MIKKIPKEVLRELKKKHRSNTDAAFITNAVLIELSHFKQFITQAEATPNCDAIRIHFVRHDLSISQPHVEKVPDRDLSQVSLAFVPAKITSSISEDWTAVDLKDQTGKILTLLVCEPVIGTRAINDDRTGQCPPKPPVCPPEDP